MDVLNEDIIGFILSYSSTKTIGKCLIICKRWKQIIEIYCWMYNLNFSKTIIKDDSLKYFKNTKQMNLKRCTQITNVGFKYLKRIHSIDLSNCHQITDYGLKYLKAVPKLIILIKNNLFG